MKSLRGNLEKKREKNWGEELKRKDREMGGIREEGGNREGGF